MTYNKEYRYLTVEYFDDSIEPTVRRTTESVIFNIINQQLNTAKEDRRKIAVYRVGECVLDMS